MRKEQGEGELLQIRQKLKTAQTAKEQIAELKANNPGANIIGANRKARRKLKAAERAGK